MIIRRSRLRAARMRGERDGEHARAAVLVYRSTMEIVCPLLLEGFCNVTTDIVSIPAPRAQLVLGISVGYISRFTNALCANVLVFSFRGTLLSKFAASFHFLRFGIIIDYVTSEILS